MVDVLSFYKDKKVLVTGHTGFKGSWLCNILLEAGADLIGYALEPATNPNLFSLLDLSSRMKSIIGDIRDFDLLLKTFQEEKPEIVFHLAAQPIVRDSYKSPLYTYDTNVMGTVNLLECIRTTTSVKSLINVTTDKVYENCDSENHPFKEDEKLDGYDPYSNSKSCSEIVTHSYFKCFLRDKNIAVSTVRAGNVIGGGDFSNDRIIPDCFRALLKNQTMVIRNPYSTRPYQHVLEPLYCYLLIAKEQYSDLSLSSAYNVGPDKVDCINTETLVKAFSKNFDDFSYIIKSDDGPHEASFLMLDNSKIKSVFGWKPCLDFNETIRLTAEWLKGFIKGESTINIVNKQIRRFFKK